MLSFTVKFVVKYRVNFYFFEIYLRNIITIFFNGILCLKLLLFSVCLHIITSTKK